MGFFSKISLPFRVNRERKYTETQVAHLLADIETAYSGVAQRYFPAASTSRLRSEWTSTINSTYDIINSEYVKLVARAKLAYDTDPYAKTAITVRESQIVGSGIRPHPKPKDADGNDIPALAKILSQYWARFNDEFMRNRDSTIYECQARFIRQKGISGGVLYNKVPNRKNSLFPFAFQEIDQDQLVFFRDQTAVLPDTTSDSTILSKTLTKNRIHHGVELDKFNDPVAYNFAGVDAPIPATNIIHAFVKSHINQTIGIPDLAPALTTLWDLQQVLENKIIASRVASAIALWMHRDDRGSLVNKKNDAGNVDWAPGRIIASSQEPKIIQANDNISDSFKPLVELYLRSVAICMGISYQELATDMAGANFSSARVITIDKRRGYEQEQKTLIRTHSKPIYRQYVEWCFLTGLIDGKTITDFNQNAWGLCEALWTPDPWDWVDPQRDISALVTARENGWLTDEMYYQRIGATRDTMYSELAKEKQMKDSLGINPAEQKVQQVKPAQIPQDEGAQDA